MSSPAPPGAIIFDLDGTLVDTVGARIAAWKAVFAELGIEIERERLGPMIGMDGRLLATEVATAAGMPIDAGTAEAIDRRAGALFDEHNRDPKPLPGARAALAYLDRAGVTWAIATSSRPEQVSASLRALELEHPPRIVDGSSVERAKPAGDSTWDMRSAVAARMSAIGVLAGSAVDERALRDAGAAVIYRTLDELTELGWA